MVFEITKKAKEKARKRRVRHEKKWLILRIISFVAFPLSTYAFIKGIFFVDFFDLDSQNRYALIFSIGLMTGVLARALILGFTSRWIEDRFNESLWIENGKLYYFFQKPAGGGINRWRTDLSGWLFISDLASITKARYDQKSGRMELNARGECIYYSDYTRQQVGKSWPMTGDFASLFYDYTEPSLYEYLKSIGVQFTEETIDFKLTDARV